MGRKWLALFLPLACLAAAFAQNPTDRLIEEALKPSPIESNLQRLTDQIGGRVPGTPAMQRAVEWGVAAFKAAGADSVHTEAFTIPASWSEGSTQISVTYSLTPSTGSGQAPGAKNVPRTGRPSGPDGFKVRAISLAWAPALAQHSHVRVVDVGDGSDEGFSKASELAGSLLLVHSEEMKTWDDLFAEYLRAPAIIDRAVRAKALAIAFQSTRPNDLLYRHTNSTDGHIDRLPMVLLAREDASRMARLLASGTKLYASIAIPNRVGGPIKAANVIAELKGSERPSEFVVLGAHLDSWELGTGALDDGCNAALVIDALRSIKASGQVPRRSIRFILFSGEEQGLLGSAAYVASHHKELDLTAAAILFDEGVGHVTGFSLGGRSDMVANVVPLLQPLRQFDAVGVTTDAFWGTDNFDFLLQGVPTFVANQEEGNYLLNYHAMSDTFDKVDIAQLKKHVADAAVLTFELADSTTRIGTRLNRAEVEQSIHDSHLDDQMKTFGLWKDWDSGKRGRSLGN